MTGRLAMIRPVRMVVSTDRGDEEVSGHVLGQASSRRLRHTHAGRWPDTGTRCSACRWTKITILYDDDASQERRYIVVSEGMSVLPGERTLGKVERTSSPLWVIECLHRRNREKQTYLSLVARSAILNAAEQDGPLREEVDRRGITLSVN